MECGIAAQLHLTFNIDITNIDITKMIDGFYSSAFKFLLEILDRSKRYEVIRTGLIHYINNGQLK